jgi:hypothetical protein
MLPTARVAAATSEIRALRNMIVLLLQVLVRKLLSLAGRRKGILLCTFTNASRSHQFRDAREPRKQWRVLNMYPALLQPRCCPACPLANPMGIDHWLLSWPVIRAPPIMAGPSLLKGCSIAGCWTRCLTHSRRAVTIGIGTHSVQGAVPYCITILPSTFASTVPSFLSSTITSLAISLPPRASTVTLPPFNAV